ncbi:MAG: hypothetical protein HDR16_08350 [Lachnospiraceae bacterium]|nr:hypothetical protein [Lachnospiraceae bacterium]
MDLEQFLYKDQIEKELEFSKVYRYLDKYINEKTFAIADIQNVNSVKQNKTIWIFWMQGMENAPALVRKCYESVCKNVPQGYDIILLTDKNLREYVSLPRFIWDKYEQGYITTTHLSDIIRVELLCTYGGCWVDATVFCSGPVPEYMVSGEMFLFQDSITEKLVIKMSSWWLCAEKTNRLMHAVRNMLYDFWEQETDIHNYFVLHIMISRLIDADAECKRIFNEIPYFNNSTPHILWRRLGREFKERDWEILRGNTPVHKLSYKKRFLRGDIDSFYQALMEGKLG